MNATKLRGEEVWAQRAIARELGVAVVQHDDNSAESMYDLRVGEAANPLVAIEVSAAVDGEFTAGWNTGPARGAQHWPLVGDWTVALARGTDNRPVRAELPAILATLELAGVTGGVEVDYLLERSDPALWAELTRVGVESVDCFRPQGSGKVSFTAGGAGGAVDRSGTHVSEWIGAWLRDDERADNLRKLAASNARERHAFVPVSMHGAGWSVESYLMWIGGHDAPTQPPDLPEPITGVWIVSTFADRGVRWDGQAWSLFAASGPGIDDDAQPH